MYVALPVPVTLTSTGYSYEYITSALFGPITTPDCLPIVQSNYSHKLRKTDTFFYFSQPSKQPFGAPWTF